MKKDQLKMSLQVASGHMLIFLFANCNRIIDGILLNRHQFYSQIDGYNSFKSVSQKMNCHVSQLLVVESQMSSTFLLLYIYVYIYIYIIYTYQVSSPSIYSPNYPRLSPSDHGTFSEWTSRFMISASDLKLLMLTWEATLEGQIGRQSQKYRSISHRPKR